MVKSNSSQPTSRPKHPSKFDKELRKMYAKQQLRTIPASTLPTAGLDIPLDQYTSFVDYLKSSTRILALFGAGAVRGVGRAHLSRRGRLLERTRCDGASDAVKPSFGIPGFVGSFTITAGTRRSERSLIEPMSHSCEAGEAQAGVPGHQPEH